MEGKKIVFIVVAIATVGGIAYYLNKRNKQNVDKLEDIKKPVLNKQDKLKEMAKIASNVKRSVEQASPITDNAYDGGGRN